jgi:Regulatory CLIP domain of proteinases
LVETSLNTKLLAEYSECINPLRQRGFCVPFNVCGFLVSKLNERTQEAFYFVQQSQCGYNQFTTFVCCPPQPPISNQKPQMNRRLEPQKLLPKAPSCGVFLDDRIIGGTKTTISEFPWFALLKYTRRMKKVQSSSDVIIDHCFLAGQANPSFSCSGTLINDRYVITGELCRENRSTNIHISTIFQLRTAFIKKFYKEQGSLLSDWASGIFKRIQIVTTVLLMKSFVMILMLTLESSRQLSMKAFCLNLLINTTT